ncbi:MAG: hypothetical protein LBD04_07725 [Synergistaceae bacterium]|jgi:hypothetical protein|nr:hypothetical protein [Synergistaceae bacterium]
MAFFMGRMLEILLKRKGTPVSAERIMESIAGAMVCSFEVNGKPCYLKCKTSETAEQIFSVTGMKKLPNLMTSKVLNRLLQLNVV